MSRRNINKADVPTLTDWYAEAAAAHGKATEEGDYKRTNREHDKLFAVYREMHARGDDGRAGLIKLLESPSDWVRLCAAAKALEFAPEVSEPLISELARENKGIIGFEAEMVLREWRAGKLRFP
ncbi:MAG: DUF2019 domain-containing protein [Chloroflexi bacterium]|nr:DUF2019 domain-containing protein [Chloroflexota bacterium]